MANENKQIKNVKDAYDRAEQEYQFWENQMKEFGYNSDNAIAAAQFYGQMAALATVQYVNYDDQSLLDRYNEIRPRLYEEDYY